MKKITIIIPTLFMGLAMFGQTGVIKKQATGKMATAKEHVPARFKNMPDAVVGTQKSPVHQGRTVSAAPFYTNTFGNAADWDLTNHAGVSTWTIGTALPAGPTTTSAIMIGSTTAADGRAMFDSDYWGDANNSPSTTGDQDAYCTLSAPIDCSTHPNVICSFQELYRCGWGDSTYLEVSNDAGFSYVPYKVNKNFSIQQWSSPNPPAVNTVSVDISATAGGQADVRIRFRYVSLVANSGWDYHWQIDDLALVDQPANDLAIDVVSGSALAIVNFSKFWEGFYTQVPLNQTGFVMFDAYVNNYGSADQTSAILSVSVDEASAGNVFTTATPQGTDLVKGSVDSLLVAVDFTSQATFINTTFAPPASKATYTATFTVTQNETDAELANNTATKTWAISDSTFAHDDGTRSTYCSPNFFTGNETEGSFGATYYVNTDDTASSVSVFIHPSTSDGNIQAEIYEIDSTSGQTAFPATTLIGSSAIHNVVAATDGNTWVTLSVKNLVTPVVLHSQMQYMAVIHATGTDYNATPSTVILLGDDKTDYQPNGQFDVNVAGTWYYTSHHPMIRLNTYAPMGTGVNNIAKNNGVNVSQNMPNPTKGISTINYELAKNAAVTLAVYDVTGKKVASQNEGSQLAGKHAIRFNAENLSEGVYYYSLTVNGTATSTMKMVVIK